MNRLILSRSITIVIAYMLVVTNYAFSQNLISNGSFELEDKSWQTQGDEMERHHQSILGVIPPTGEYYAELANSKGYELFQEVEVEVGAHYEVSFFAQARPRVTERESHFVFKVNEQLMANIQPDLGTWNRYAFTVEANSPRMKISLEDTYFGKDGIGAMIDDVEIRKQAPTYTQIFNGKTLDGWKVYAKPKDLEKNYWKVENAAIVCNTMGDKDHSAVWLFYEEELSDFELRIKIQAYRDSPGNSGIQIRSRYTESGDIEGPQIDIHPPGPFRNALLYDETEGYNHWVFPKMPGSGLKKEDANNQSDFYYSDDKPSWNELQVICRGTSVKTILNGTLVTDFNGDGILNDTIHIKQNVGMKGKIALQVHGGHEILIAFKDIQLKKL